MADQPGGGRPGGGGDEGAGGDARAPFDETVQIRMAPLAAKAARRPRTRADTGTGTAAATRTRRPFTPFAPFVIPKSPTPRAVLSRALSVPLVVALVLVLPLAVAGRSQPDVRDAVFWLQLATTCYAGARLSAMVLTTRRRLIQGTVWLFCYVAMGVAPLAQIVLEQTPTPTVGTRGDFTQAVALVLVGFVAFDVGALLSRHASEARLNRRPRPVASINKRRLYVLVFVAYACSGLFIASLGGPAPFFGSREAISDELGGGASDSQVGSAFVRGFGTVPALLALLMLTRWMVMSRRARRQPGVVLPWAGLVLVNVIVNNPISNPRYWFLTVAFALLFTAFPRSSVVYRSALAGGVALAVLLFPFADKFRYDESGRKETRSQSVLDPLVMKDYDQTVMFANTISYVDSGVGHTYGKQMASSAFFFVPRSVWDGKQLDSGVKVGTWMGMTNVNLSSPLWTELWLDFGPLGVAGGLLLVGYAAARTDRRFAESGHVSRDPGNVLATVVPLIAGYSFILLRGPLLQATGRIGIAVVCLALVATFRPDERRRLR
ncbi:O-antigen polymerase [Streptomyces sp. MAR4 CNX-425]|uniref:O-antigen polymerase n=1 Tax=Streptomyces sp. MAR4 CNX-425 TaxID=3406343 RepID=UPI003B50B57B